MSEENLTDNGENLPNGASAAADKIDGIKTKIDGIVEQALGLVGDHPWEKWLDATNRFVTAMAPLLIALAAVVGCIGGLILAIRADVRISLALKNLWILLFGIFSMHLAPKAMVLPHAFNTKKEIDVVRPELLYILKIVLGLGGLVATICSLLTFTSDGCIAALVTAVVAIMSIIVFSRTEAIGVKAGIPANCVEEIVSLVMLPIRIVLSMMTLLIGIGLVAGIIYGIVELCDSGLAGAGMPILVLSVLMPVIAPLCIYLVYLKATFILTISRAIVSIPGKLDALRK